jgi:hypothetical protein
MWALLNSDNTINKILTRPKALTIGDVNYPANIFSMWTSVDLEALKIYEVVIDNTNFKDEHYYINTDQTFAFASGAVTASFGTATGKLIADTLYTSSEVAADVHEVGHAKAGQRINTWVEGDVKTRGLKYSHKVAINEGAAGQLQSTDWMVVRATEGGTAVPSATTTWRAAVRTKANAMCTAIDGAADVDALAALYVYNSDSPPVRPLGDFPVLGA